MQIDADLVARLSERTMAAAIAPDGWQLLLDDIQQVGGGLNCHLYVQDLRMQASPVSIASGYDPDYVRSFHEHYSALNAWAPVFAAAPSGAILFSGEMCPDDEMVRTEFYNDWVRPQGDLIGGGGSVIWNDAHRAVLFGANIPRRIRDKAEPEWIRLTALLTPVLQRAFDISRLTTSLELGRFAVNGAGSRGGAVFCVDRRRRVIFCNDVGAALLEAGEVVRSGPQGRLEFVDERPMKAFEGAVLSLTLEGLGHSSKFTCPPVLHRQSFTCATAKLTAEALQQTGLGFLVGPVGAALVLVMQECDGAREPVALLMDASGLSRREAEVTLKLAAGSTATEIAEAEGLSVHTVRNQIKAAMAKLGVRRQIDLVRWVTSAEALG